MNLYRILEIEETNDINEIKHAYNKMIKKYHPDKNGNTPESNEKFQKINLRLR